MLKRLALITMTPYYGPRCFGSIIIGSAQCDLQALAANFRNSRAALLLFAGAETYPVANGSGTALPSVIRAVWLKSRGLNGTNGIGPRQTFLRTDDGM